MTDWNALGGNPVTGNADSVRSAAGLLRDVARLADTLERDLDRVLGGCGTDAWRGPAADAARARLADLLPDLRKFSDSHEQAGSALGWYADRLDSAQQTARSAAGQATQSVDDRRRAADRCSTWQVEIRGIDSRLRNDRQQLVAARIKSAGASVVDPAYAAEWQRYAQGLEQRIAAEEVRLRNAHRSKSAAESDVAAADALMEAARRLAGSAREARDDAAHSTVQRIEAAGRAGIANRNAVQRTLDAAVAGVRTVAGSKVFKEFLDALDVVATVVGVIGVVLTIFFPPLGAAFIGAGLALSALHFAGTALAYWARNAEVGVGDLFLSGVGMVLAAVPFLKVAKVIRIVAKGGAVESDIVRAARMVKRSLSYDDGRGVRRVLNQNGLPPHLLDRVEVAGKVAGRELRVLTKLHIDAAGYYAAKTGAHIAHIGYQLFDQAREVSELLSPSEPWSDAEKAGRATVKVLGEWVDGATDFLPDNPAGTATKVVVHEGVHWLDEKVENIR